MFTQQTYWIESSRLAMVRKIIGEISPIRNPNFRPKPIGNGLAEMEIHFYSRSNKSVFEDSLSHENIGFVRV